MRLSGVSEAQYDMLWYSEYDITVVTCHTDIANKGMQSYLASKNVPQGLKQLRPSIVSDINDIII